MRILTWHVHGSYLYYLSHLPHEIYLPVRPNPVGGYGGRGSTFPFGPNVHDVDARDIAGMDFDCLLYQSPANFLHDRIELLSERQRALPSVYLEHDPPRESPFDTPHPVDDGTLVVHVTPFNALMWQNSGPVRVIEHGVVLPPGVAYSGEIERGVVLVNNLATRGRRLGYDVYQDVRQRLPLDLFGMNAAQAGGIGELPPMEAAAVAARYRFFLNPIRWTSLGLAVCEAMLAGMPIVGLATTEMVTAVEHGRSGFVTTRPDELNLYGWRLLRDRELARQMGRRARQAALDRFGIDRFVRDWDETLTGVVAQRGRLPLRAGAA